MVSVALTRSPPRCAENTRVLDILQVTFPFFALVLCGYVAARWRMLPFEAISGLNTFVPFFALPCILFRFGAATPIRHRVDPAALVAYLL
jgi:malonate transporter